MWTGGTLIRVIRLWQLIRVFTVCMWASSRENLFLPYANDKGADQPAHLHSVIGAFVVHCLACIIPILPISKIWRLASFCNWAAWFEPYLVANPKDRFSRDTAHVFCKFCCATSSMVFQEISRLMTKPTKWRVRPAQTQISLGMRPVWSESSLSAWRKLRSLATHWAHSKDSDQTGWMPRLIWVSTVCTGHFVGFVVRHLICHLVVLQSESLITKYSENTLSVG